MIKLLIILFIISCMPISLSFNLKTHNNFKDIDVKNCTYYFSDDKIDTKNIDTSQINTDKKSYKNVFRYFIEYLAIKDLRNVKTNIVDLLYLFYK